MYRRLPILALVLCASAAQASPWAEAKRTIRRDPEPKQLTRDRHYVVSDEQRHDLFRGAIAGLGGVFIGVGTNQNYLMAGWARPEVMVIVDFDQVVIDLHKVYRAVFMTAETPEEFARLWGRERKARRAVRRAIRRTVRGPEQRKRVLAVFKEYRPNVNRQMNVVRQRMTELGVPCFLDDAQQYAFLHRLFLDDGVRVVRGDFTGRRTFRDIGRVLTDLDLTARVIYMSNVEQYVGWNRGRFRKNFAELPIDDRSVVLRTYGVGEEGIDGNYHYYVQPADVFHAWLASRRTHLASKMLETQQPSEAAGLFELPLRPEELAEADEPRGKRKHRGPTGVPAQTADETSGTRP